KLLRLDPHNRINPRIEIRSPVEHGSPDDVFLELGSEPCHGGGDAVIQKSAKSAALSTERTGNNPICLLERFIAAWKTIRRHGVTPILVPERQPHPGPLITSKYCCIIA